MINQPQEPLLLSDGELDVVAGGRLGLDGNDQIALNEFNGALPDEEKHVAAVCYGVSVLAYARVDGASL